MLIETLTLGFALTAMWVGTILETPTTIILVSFATIVVEDDRRLKATGTGGGFATIAFTETIKEISSMKMETKSAAARCRDMIVSALSVKKSAVGIRMIIIFGTARNCF